MDDHDGLAERFEAQRGRLRAVAYRMLGSLSEADDAVQEAWLRLGRADPGAVPFDQVGAVLGRSEAAARQLASRARRRVQGAAPAPDPDLAGQHRVVGAFLAAARGGDLRGLLAVLDPEVVVRADGGPLRPGGVVRGAAAAATQALDFARFARVARPALVNGAAGLVAAAGGRPISVLAFTVAGGMIVEIDILTDPERLRRLDLAALDR